MATCYITEWRGIGTVPSQNPAINQGEMTMQAPGGFQATNNVSFSAAVQTAAFGANTYLIEVSPDAICSVLIGDNPTATAANMRIAADQVRYYVVRPGQKISVIANT